MEYNNHAYEITPNVISNITRASWYLISPGLNRYLFHRLCVLTTKKQQSSALLAFFVWVRRGLMDSPHKGPVTGKAFPCLSTSLWWTCQPILVWSFLLCDIWRITNYVKFYTFCCGKDDSHCQLINVDVSNLPQSINLPQITKWVKCMFQWMTMIGRLVILLARIQGHTIQHSKHITQ